MIRGAASFTRQDKNVRTLLESYYRTFHVQVKPGLEFLCDFPDENYTVSVDPMRLQQVVTNFLSNANKFTESDISGWDTAISPKKIKSVFLSRIQGGHPQK